MENFDQIFTLMATSEGIGLNSDILETGLLNIIALIGILIISGKDFLNSYLEKRKETIFKSVQDAEERVEEAHERLIEARRQLDLKHLLILNIQIETLNTRKLTLETDIVDARKDLKSRFERAILAFNSNERQVFFEIKEQVTSLVLHQALKKAIRVYNSDRLENKDLIDNTIRIFELPS